MPRGDGLCQWCGKIPFATRQQAWAKIGHLPTDRFNRSTLQVYKCPHGGGFHLYTLMRNCRKRKKKRE